MPDLLKIKTSLRQFILKQIAAHPANQPVKYITFGYEVAQGGLFCVFLDTRPDAGPDGTWTVNLETNSIEMPDWPEYAEQLEESDEGFEFTLGETLKDLVFELRAQGAFATLPKQDNCEFGLEEMNGSYGWPAWEDRRKENLV